MTIRISARARARIRGEDAWWRDQRRDAPELFKLELTQAFERILRALRTRCPYGDFEGKVVWRILMPQTEQHVYYSIDNETADVVIETVWGARRGRGPKL